MRQRSPREIETKFATVVASARGRTNLADAEGTEQRVTEVLINARCDLWDEGTAARLSPSQIETMANRHLEWDINNDPWPKPSDLPDGNVVPFRGNNVAPFRRPCRQ
jgi:hypothetical protein